MNRYNRQIILPEIGKEGQQKIGKTSVLVVGVGGLGNVVCSYLTAAGIGKLVMIDADTVSVHNLQRQILYREPQVGESKALEAKKTLQELNSEVEIIAYNEFFDEQNAAKLIKDVDIVIDATDNYKTRYLINDVCVGLNKTFIYGAIADFTGQVSVFNYKKGATYRCLYPDEKEMIAMQKQTIGVMGILPGIIGCLQVNEALKLICGYGNLFNDKLFQIDLQTNQTFSIDIPVTKEGREISMKQ
jgi:adenylyltransferase/sulfurtransferase